MNSRKTSVGIAVRKASGFERTGTLLFIQKGAQYMIREICGGSHGVGRWFVEPHGYIDGKAFRAIICLRGFCVFRTKRVDNQLMIAAIFIT
jgi:hypothetical protein